MDSVVVWLYYLVCISIILQEEIKYTRNISTLCENAIGIMRVGKS